MLKIEFRTNDDSMVENASAEVARSFDKIVRMIERDGLDKCFYYHLNDVNGNTIGYVENDPQMN